MCIVTLIIMEACFSCVLVIVKCLFDLFSLSITKCLSVAEEQFPNWCEERMELPIFEDLPPPPLVNSLDVSGLKPSVTPNPAYLDLISLKSNNNNEKPQPNFNLITLKTPVAASNLTGQKVPQAMGKVEIVGVKHQNQNIIPMTVQQIPSPASVPIALVQMPQVLPQSQLLMQEFGYPIESNHETLTPPESPKGAELQMLTMLQEMQDEELDELVRIRVESLVETPQHSGDNSCSSLHEESESVASPSSDSGYSDPEWTVPSFSELKSPKKKRGMKPYIRVPPEEKRQRKKEQNKNAATRYRIKKKQEIEEILGEEKSLRDKHEQLKTELVDVKREIKYLKNLMRDVFKAKGLVK